MLARHPWVYADSIASVSGSPEAGAQVQVRDRSGAVLGWALWSPGSVIRARMLSFDEEEIIWHGLFEDRFAQAGKHRERFVADDTDSCRLVFGEGDGLPGLVVDKYGDYLAVTFTTGGTAARAGEITDALVKVFGPAGIIAIEDPALERKEGFTHPCGVVSGSVPDELAVIENGVKYEVGVHTAQRKMHYFDQRENRAAVAAIASGKMLDLCCYTGGFALNALLHGKVELALCVDSSAPALSATEHNAALNGVGDKLGTLQGDIAGVCSELARDGHSFGCVVLDPPKLAPDRRSIEPALKKYAVLNELAVSLVEPGGLFVTCSCSGLVREEQFLRSVAIGAARAERTLRLIELRGQAPCHPVSPFCPETMYLKCALFAVE